MKPFARLLAKIKQVAEPVPEGYLLKQKLDFFLPLIGIEPLQAAIANGLTTKDLLQLFTEAGVRTSQRSIERHLPPLLGIKRQKKDKAPSPTATELTNTQTERVKFQGISLPAKVGQVGARRLTPKELEEEARLKFYPAVKKHKGRENQ